MKENKEKEQSWDCNKGYKSWHHHGSNGVGGAFYGFGFVGVLIYYLQQATSFQMGVIGFLKAIVWPAFLMYDVFKLLKL